MTARRRWLVAAVAASVALASPLLVGCDTKAKKQARLAVTDVDELATVVVERHVRALEGALPALARTLATKLGDAATMESRREELAAALTAEVGRSDALRSARRSYYALVDREGVLLWVEDEAWKVVGRRLVPSFAPVAQALAGQDFARGGGRYGGASAEAFTLVSAAPVRGSSGVAGAVVAAWELGDAAGDLQRQRVTALRMAQAPAKAHTKQKERLAMDLAAPDVWVAWVRAGHAHLREDAPSTLVESVAALQLDRVLAGPGDRWEGTFSVLNKEWGGAARRIPELEDVILAVVRLDP